MFLRQDIENFNLGGLQIREGNQYIHTWNDRIKCAADVIGSIMDSKSISQGSSPWRRAAVT